ncbi:hypothetical protein [Paenibacillus sp. JJ-223]|uniref:hypothetical protein n=1 Tax=Paenibacillus sp. JJ-223 TaxID=2905647 RepID=UPI001F1A209C|nr:hypothetical protein [Paenibacillus sp. JJ-223]CAH1201890.1 hypothetical protein PAECIP111890_02047 [Paenibacillus sp. JJ-223]
MAYRLSHKKKCIFVAIHVISASSWIGGTLGMLLLGLYLYSAANGEQLAYTLASMEIIDENLLKYPALMTLLTGILLSIWTQWGLVKHYWIVIKLILTLTTILIGIFFLNHWTASLVDMVSETGFATLQDHNFRSKWLAILLTASFNLLCLFIMVFITYFKPFGKIKKRRATNSYKPSERN